MSDIDQIADSIRKAGPNGTSIARTYLDSNHVIKSPGTLDLVNFSDSYAFTKSVARGKEGQVSENFARERHNFDNAYNSYAQSDEGKKHPVDRKDFAEALSRIYERGFGEREKPDGSKTNVKTQKEMERVDREIGKLGSTHVLPTVRELNAAGPNAEQHLATIRPLHENHPGGQNHFQHDAAKFGEIVGSIPREVAHFIESSFAHFRHSGITIETAHTAPQPHFVHGNRGAGHFEAVVKL